MAVLLSGATGFFGGHLLAALGAEAGPIYVWLREGPKLTAELRRLQALAPQATLRVVHAPEAVDGPLSAVFHLAALVRHSRQGAAEVYAVNVGLTERMARVAAARGARLIYVSTSGTVGCARDAAAAPLEDAPFCTEVVRRWPYYASKVAAETRLRALASELQLRLVVFRPPMLLGPGDHRLRATGQVLRFLRGRLPFLLRGGMHYVDVRDSAAALVAASRLPAPRPVYHLRGTACTIGEFFAEVGRQSARPPPRLELPHVLARLLSQGDAAVGRAWRGRPLGLLPDPVVIEMAAHYWDIGSVHAERDLQFSPRPGRETLRDTVAWLQRHAAA